MRTFLIALILALFAFRAPGLAAQPDQSGQPNQTGQLNQSGQLNQPDPAGQAEPPRPGFIPEDFVFGYHKKSETGGITTIFLKYVPRGETVEKGSEMITVIFTILDAKTVVQPRVQAELTAEHWLRSCPGGVAEVVRYPDGPERQTGLRAECPKGRLTDKRESVFMKYVLYGSAEENRFVLVNVQRAVIGDKPKRSMAQLREWVEQAQDFNPRQ